MKESESTGAPPLEGTTPSEGDTGGKEDGKGNINPELWYACAGPLVNVPPAGSLVVYLPQGHSEQVAATMHKNADMQIPSYPNLPWKLICFLHNVNLHADPETDEVYAQITLQPVNTNDKETFPTLDLATKPNRPQAEFFCKTLTASDTSTHGGFSVPRRAAEKIFPALDFSMQPPAQELKARDLHGNIWTFRHIFRGQPKRHLLTTGWSLFVSGKRLFAGDSVLFVRNEKQQLFVGIRRANRQPTNISSSVLSSDSMQIGVLAAAAHAYANNSIFTVFYNPRASPSEFVIPLEKYNKAIYSNQITLGMRFRMMFETEESGTRRYMGTITSISDLDPVRWKNSKWRNLQVGWDESVSGERRNRVSLWEIEPVQAPFFICPPPFFMSKRLRQPGMPDDELMDTNLFKRVVPWLSDEICMKDNMSQNGAMSGTNLVQWMKMQNVSLSNFASQADHIQSLTGTIQHNYGAMGVSGQLGLNTQIFQQNSIQFNAPKFQQQLQQTGPLPKLSVSLDQPSASAIRCDGLQDINVHQKHQLTVNQSLHSNKTCNKLVQPQTLFQNQVLQQKPQFQGRLPPSTTLVSQTQQLQRQPKPQELQHLSHELLQSQQSELLQLQQQQQSRGSGQQIHRASQQLQLPEQQINVQLPQKLQQQQQCLPTQTMIQQPQKTTEVQQRYLGAKQYLSNDNSLSQQHMVLNFSTKGTSESTVKFQSMQCQSTQKLQQSQGITTEMLGNFPQTSSNMPSTTCSNLLNTGGMQSVLTADIPSCSTSPSAENCSVAPYRVMSKAQFDPLMAEVPCSAIINLNPGSCNPNKRVVSDWKKFDVKPSVSVPKSQNHGTLFPQMFTTSKVEMDFDTPSSTTSVYLPQVDAQSQRSFPVSSFGQQQMPFRDTSQDDVLASNPGVDDAFGINVGSQMGASVLHDSLLMKNIESVEDYQNPLASDMVSNHGGSKEGQAELSSSIISKSFGATDVAFSSIDSTIDDTSLLSQCLRPPPPQLQRMRTYTKVYKRGAVGRSIDITRYSGYDELKRDIARMFSIEGQLEDRQRIGWKLVYVDHEKDVLLVGDDPWEEFVNCVRSIKILSPQEVQQMSLEGDKRGNDAPTNQACSSSDCGNTWKDMCDNISANPSIESYDYF